MEKTLRVAVGGASVVSPMYIAEISPEKWRGRLGTLFQLGIVTGIFLTLFVNAWAHAPSTRYCMPAIFTGRYPSQVIWQEPPWWPALGTGHCSPWSSRRS